MNSIKPHNNLGLIARVISAPILLFSLVTIFAHVIFPDTEPGTYPPVENWLPVLMMFSVMGLALAWRWEYFGGTVTLFFFIVHLYAYWKIREQFFPLNVLVLFSPLFIDGVLFLVNGLRRREE